MNGLIGCDGSSGEFAEVGVGGSHLPVGKHVRVGRGAVDPVGVEPYHLFSTGQPDQGLAARFDQTPRPGHGYQVSPRVQLVSIPV